VKEKIILKHRGTHYVVQSLENRVSPRIGMALSEDQVENLLLEAKIHKTLTVKIV
jgi:hypothetical protein